MAGVLSFALGLETSAFSGGLDRAAGRLFAFISIGKAVQFALEGVMGAIGRGGALNDLSARTGESVGNLYMLEEAFAVVGVSVDSLPGMINRLNKSLSGVGEMGEKTDEAFAALGLSAEDLKRMDAPAQFNAIISQLGKLDKAEGIDVASRIFGRDGAGNMMQIVRDAKSFRDTLAASRREAAVFQRTADAFGLIGDTIRRIKGSIGGMFAGIAEGIVPTLQHVLNLLNQMDLVAVGQDIGKMFSGAFQAFREGEVTQLITESIAFGFKAAAELAPVVFAGLGVAILKAFETPFAYIQSFFEWMGQKSIELGEKFGRMIHKAMNPGSKVDVNGGFKAQSFGEIMNERRENGVDYWTQGNNTDEMARQVGEMGKSAAEAIENGWGNLFKRFEGFASRAPQIEGAAKKDGDPNAAKPGFESVSNRQSSGWENIGLFSGGAAHQVQQSQLTIQRKMSQTLSDIRDKIKPGYSALVNA
jgi:hypothetical protein